MVKREKLKIQDMDLEELIKKLIKIKKSFIHLSQELDPIRIDERKRISHRPRYVENMVEKIRREYNFYYDIFYCLGERLNKAEQLYLKK